jgi:hypothetical protein
MTNELTTSTNTVITLKLPAVEDNTRAGTILVQCGGWLNGPCPYAGRHKHGDRHSSFGINTRTGYGFCHVCGSMLLKELRVILSI